MAPEPAKPAEPVIRVITNWVLYHEKIIGESTGWEHVRDGTDVVTSRVVRTWKTDIGTYVETKGGSVYRLGKQHEGKFP